MEKEEPLGYQFKLIHEKFKKLQNRDLAHLDLTFSQMAVICYLGDNQGKRITQKDIVRKLDLKHTTIIGILKRLESKDMIRQVTDPENKRCKNVTMTEKALRDFDAVQKHRRAMDGILTSSLTKEETEQLKGLLTKVLNSLPDT